MATRSDSRNCQGFAHTGCMPLPCSGRLTVTCDPDSLATLLANFSLLKEVPRGGQGSGMCWPDGPGRSWVGLSQEAEQVGCEQKPWATVSSVRVKVGELPAFWGWRWGGPCPVTLSKNKAASTNSQHNTGIPPSRKKKA